ncbi:MULTISPECIES: 16S rRNA (adenine(1518)-N(6)/adenine(1519)-N(6))-dimethyltransferase RsmA [Methanococcoides]|uniref:Probable ribosomal RNA small subunit methyltransferase A n=1 Tax=Methanococcoides seepicolus TaxID=2828780 RepID=A0A9E4ZED4_9EURY|nr:MULTISPECIES: 16S rRNA (adenine(1518)-N(6)/adenine(1519)-N(6))-dimethyltransferase RsmA [Methanococcoides]MCM1986117.1 16S ribosomal RNA methyltransferase A [Methanococcoides seepicolus]
MVRKILQKYGIRGGCHDQHFLIDERSLDSIVDQAELSEKDVVLEIGGGIGNLTERLLEKAGKVYVIELDPALVHVLKDRFSDNEKIEIIPGDVLKLDLPKFNKVVANLPYSISSPITFKLFKHEFELGILMYQYEFAQRMVAKANTEDYSRLSVNTHYFADADIIMKIPPSAFSPPPEVWSAVVKVVPRPSSFHVEDPQFFLDLVTAVFLQRRKKLRNAIIKGNHLLNVPNIKQIVAELPEEFMSKRAENLEPHELAEIANHIFKMKATS